jgi:threonine dehydrogenase-like Zn-dependent dehydrogenase
MRALVYTDPNALELREQSVSAAVEGEVVVKVEAVGICGSDMHAYHGYDSRRPAPLILGHEAAGRIVTGPRAGERVTINPLIVDPAAPTPSRAARTFRRRAKSCRCRHDQARSPNSCVCRSAMWSSSRISGQTRSVCPEIMLKQRDEIMTRFSQIGFMIS